MRLIDADALQVVTECCVDEAGFFAKFNVVHEEEIQKAPTIDSSTLAPRWVSVKERLPSELPKDNGAWSKEVRPSEIVLVKRKDLKDLQAAWYSYEYKCWTNAEETHSFSGVTHWQPLPEPPKRGENNA